MAITNYGDLKAAVADQLDRSDLTSQIVTFIAQAESRINRELRAALQDKRSTLTVTGGSDYATLPSDFRQMRNVSVVQTPPRVLEFVTMNELEQVYTGSGTPQVFTIVGTEIRVAPTPDTDITLNIYYVSNLAAFSDDADTNALLTTHPDLYLYGALEHAYAFLMDEQRMQFYREQVRNIIFEINKDEADQRFAAGLVLPTPYGERYNIRFS